MNATIIWEDMTKLSGVGTWIHQAVVGLQEFGIQASVLDIAQTRLGHDSRQSIRDRIVEISRPARASEYRWRKQIRAALDQLDTDIVVFHDHRHVEDVLNALPGNFPAMNVLHLDRPDEVYDQRIQDLAERVHAFPCVSKTVVARAQKHVGDRARFCPLGIAIPKHWSDRPLGTPLRAIFVGRIAQEQKRILDLIPFAETAGDAVVVDVYGDGNAMDALRAAELSNVTLHGAVSHADVLAAMDEADVLLLFSEYEGLPLVLLEASARGVIPVVTDIRSGVGELVRHGENGLLFPVGDPVAASNLVRGGVLHAGMRKAARSLGESFRFCDCLQAYAQWMHDLVAENAYVKDEMSFRPRGRAWLRDRMCV